MASNRREQIKYQVGRSIFAIGDYIIGDEDDAFTEKLRQDSRLLLFSKHRVVRRSSWYVNHCNLTHKRKLKDAGKLIEHEHQIKLYEIERSQDKMSKLYKQYQKKLRKSVSLPDIEETRSTFQSLAEEVFPKVKISEFDRRSLPWKREEGSDSFRLPLFKRRFSLRESVLLSSDSCFSEEDEVAMSKLENDSKVLTKSMQSSISSSRNLSSHNQMSTKTSVQSSILSSRNLSSQMLAKKSLPKLLPLQFEQRTTQLVTGTSEYEDRIVKQQNGKLTQHQKRLNDWRQSESYRSELMWNEFERIMRCFSEYLQIDYKPHRVKAKAEGTLQKNQQPVSEQPHSLLENTAFIRSFYFPHGEPDEIVFKH